MSGYAGYGQFANAGQQGYQNAQQGYQNAQQGYQNMQQAYQGAQQQGNQMTQFPPVAGQQQPYQQVQQYAQPAMQPVQQAQYGINQAQYGFNQAQNAGQQVQYAGQQFAGGQYAAGTAAAMGAGASAMAAAQPAYSHMQMQQQMSPQGQYGQFAPKPLQIAPASTARPTGPQQWGTSLYDCCDDCFIFCQSAPVLYGENYRKLYGDGFCSCCLLYCLCGSFACFFANNTRATLRAKYNLPEEPCGDCCVHFWCSPCAVCQEARELRRREGWQTWAS